MKNKANMFINYILY